MAETPAGTNSANQTESPTVIPTSGVNAVPSRVQADDDGARLRGVVALPHHRETLFTDEVHLDPATLARWQPHISLDESRLIDDGHE